MAQGIHRTSKNGPGPDAAIKQTGAAVSVVVTWFFGSLGRFPLESLGLIATLLVLVLVSIAAGLAFLHRGRERKTSLAACLVPVLLLGAISAFSFGLLPFQSTPSEVIAAGVRTKLDDRIGIAPPRGQVIVRPISAASPQGRDLGAALERALGESTASVRGQGSIEIAATVDGVYTHHAARQYRGRAAVVLRVRESGLRCSLHLERDGAIDGVARSFARDIARQAQSMVEGSTEC